MVIVGPVNQLTLIFWMKMPKNIGAHYLATKILKDQIIYTIFGMIWTNHPSSVQILILFLWQWSIRNLMVEFLNTVIFIMPMEQFINEVLTLVYCKEIIKLCDLLFLLEVFSLEVKNLEHIGQETIDLSQMKHKVQSICYFQLE